MEETRTILTKMEEYSKIKEKDIVVERIVPKYKSWKKVGEQLLVIGTILEADEKNKIYICSIKGRGGNPAISAVCLSGNEIMIISYAKEGLIKQNTARKVTEKIIDALM